MNRFALFTDISFNPKMNIGFGAYLFIAQADIETVSYDSIQKNIITNIFHSNSSTKLELENLLWALDEVENANKTDELKSNLIIYTDSQCIAGLMGRRFQLEGSDFTSKAKNRELNNTGLYQRLYRHHDKLEFEIIKLKGHLKSSEKDRLHILFSLVDKKSRKSLRQWLKTFGKS